jgi:hypothetical protein
MLFQTRQQLMVSRIRFVSHEFNKWWCGLSIEELNSNFLLRIRIAEIEKYLKELEVAYGCNS